jgi:hypothetical protein
MNTKNILYMADGADGGGKPEPKSKADSRVSLNKATVSVRARMDVRRHGVDLRKGKEGKVTPFQADLLQDELETL